MKALRELIGPIAFLLIIMSGVGSVALEAMGFISTETMHAALMSIIYMTFIGGLIILLVSLAWVIIRPNPKKR